MDVIFFRLGLVLSKGDWYTPRFKGKHLSQNQGPQNQTIPVLLQIPLEVFWDQRICEVNPDPSKK